LAIDTSRHRMRSWRNKLRPRSFCAAEGVRAHRFQEEDISRPSIGRFSKRPIHCGGSSSSCEGPARCRLPDGVLSSYTVRPPSDGEIARSWAMATSLDHLRDQGKRL